jgi:hypothetical protein
MSGRAWANAAEGDRRRKLEQVRVHGAAGSVEEPIVAPPVDLEALVRSVPEDFDDLREPSAVIAAPAAAAELVAEEPVAEEAAAEEAPEPEADADDVNRDADAVEVEADAEAQAEPEPHEAPELAEGPEPADPEVDATSISTERPSVAADPPEKVLGESSE